jgi:hypothetical protein
VSRRGATATVGQPLALLVALVSYTDPDDDQHRWAVLHRWAVAEQPEHDRRPTDGCELVDTDDLDEAIGRYEQLVRDEADAGDPWTFDYTDVRGVSGVDRSQHDPNVRARLIEALVVHRRWAAATEVIDWLGDHRVIAIARAVRAHGYGGQSALARKLGLKQSTIAAACRRAAALCTYTVLVEPLDRDEDDLRDWVSAAGTVTNLDMTSPERAARLSVPADLVARDAAVRVSVWRGAVPAGQPDPDCVLSGRAAEVAAGPASGGDRCAGCEG